MKEYRSRRGEAWALAGAIVLLAVVVIGGTALGWHLAKGVPPVPYASTGASSDSSTAADGSAAAGLPGAPDSGESRGESGLGSTADSTSAAAASSGPVLTQPQYVQAVAAWQRHVAGLPGITNRPDQVAEDCLATLVPDAREPVTKNFVPAPTVAAGMTVELARLGDNPDPGFPVQLAQCVVAHRSGTHSEAVEAGAAVGLVMLPATPASRFLYIAVVGNVGLIASGPDPVADILTGVVPLLQAAVTEARDT